MSGSGDHQKVQDGFLVVPTTISTSLISFQEQYTFVHDAMLEHLFCKNTFVKAADFAARLKSLQEQNTETGNTHLEDEYAVSMHCCINRIQYLDNNNRTLSIWRSSCKIGGFVLGRGTLRGSAVTE